MQLLVLFTQFIQQTNTCLKPYVLRHLCLFIVLFSSKNPVYSQNTETLFKQAQTLAQASKYDSAIVLLNKICEKEPNNLDVRLYRARVNAWHKNFDIAEEEARAVFYKQPKNREVLAFIADIYLWSKQWEKLEQTTQNALKTAPKFANQEEGLMDSITFIKKYAYSLIEQNRFQEAEKALFPLKDYLFSLWDFVKSKLIHHSIRAQQTYIAFNTDQKDWTITDIEYTHKLKKVTLLGSFNHANRFGKTGNQLMVQAYPRISNRSYLWLIAGLADGKTHPDMIYGGNFFLYPHKYIETEIGMRVFKVKNSETALILRGGIVFQKMTHRGGYNIAQVRSVNATGFAHSFFYQNYFDKHDSYIRVGMGTGSNANSTLLPQFDNFIINSLSFNASSSYYLHRHWRLLGGLAWERSKNQGGTNTQSRLIFDLGMLYKF